MPYLVNKQVPFPQHIFSCLFQGQFTCDGNGLSCYNLIMLELWSYVSITFSSFFALIRTVFTGNLACLILNIVANLATTVLVEVLLAVRELDC